MEFSGKTTIKDGRGRTHRVSNGLYYILLAAFKMTRTKHFGGERERWNIYQGSWSSGSQSAGTHSGSGAIDTSSYNQQNRVFVMCLLGLYSWYRRRSSRWVAHIHGIVAGDGKADDLARRQVQAKINDRDGLAGNARDTSIPQMLVFPLFVAPWKETGKYGQRWITQSCHAYTQQTTRAPQYGEFKRGDVIETIAVTAVIKDGVKKYWHITADGRCFHEANVSREPVAA